VLEKSQFKTHAIVSVMTGQKEYMLLDNSEKADILKIGVGLTKHIENHKLDPES
jgi:hypothetical protein